MGIPNTKPEVVTLYKHFVRLAATHQVEGVAHPDQENRADMLVKEMGNLGIPERTVRETLQAAHEWGVETIGFTPPSVHIKVEII